MGQVTETDDRRGGPLALALALAHKPAEAGPATPEV